MKAVKVDTVWVSQHLIGSIFNGHIGHLDAHEEGNLVRWYAFYESEEGNALAFDVVDYEPSFATCDVLGIKSMCVELEIYELKP